jgi:hypothetical protein
LVSNKKLLQFFTDSMPTPKRDELLAELKKANADPLGGYSVILKYAFNSYLHSEPELRTLMTIALETASEQGVVGVPRASAKRQVLVDRFVRQMLTASSVSDLPRIPLKFRSSKNSGADSRAGRHRDRAAGYADTSSGTAAHAGADSSATFGGFYIPALLLCIIITILWGPPISALSEAEMEGLVESLVKDYNADPEAFRSASAIVKLISFASDAASFVAGIQVGRQLSTRE